MAHEAVTILGGGNTAFSVAADLTLRGYRVILYEIPGAEASLAPVRNTSTIYLKGVAAHGAAVIHRMTTDIEDSVTGVGPRSPDRSSLRPQTIC